MQKKKCFSSAIQGLVASEIITFSKNIDEKVQGTNTANLKADFLFQNYLKELSVLL